jgi:tRNA A37 threonylcarbamoyladenosine dehydratase
MGSGGKLDPSKIQVADISKTYQCPLAAAYGNDCVRMEFTKGVKAVFSTEINSYETKKRKG